MTYKHGWGQRPCACLPVRCRPNRWCRRENPCCRGRTSTQLKVAFSVAAGDVEITSDDRLILTPRLTTKAGDTLTLPPVELAGERNRRYFDRRAALRGEERAAVAAASDTLDLIRW